MFAEFANHQEFEIPAGEEVATARSELREWMKRGLIVEGGTSYRHRRPTEGISFSGHLE
jgi:hypothetical protein